MTAPNAFRAYTGNFAGTALTTIEDMTVHQGGQAVDFISDASAVVTAVFVDNIAADVTLTISDFTQAKASTVTPGSNGALIMVFQLRAEGKGAAGSGNATGTFVSASVVSIDFKAGTNGTGTAVITFRCSSAGGTSIVTWT